MADPFGPFPGSFAYAVYGGIYRNVWLVITDTVRIERVLNATPEISGNTGKVRVRTTLSNGASGEKKVKLVTSVSDSGKTRVSSGTIST